VNVTVPDPLAIALAEYELDVIKSSKSSVYEPLAESPENDAVNEVELFNLKISINAPLKYYIIYKNRRGEHFCSPL
jgi:hypothetical protein